MNSKLTLLYDKRFNVEFIHDMKYDVRRNNPDELHDYFNILASVMYYFMDNKHAGAHESHHYLYDCDFGFTILLQLNEDWFQRR